MRRSSSILLLIGLCTFPGCGDFGGEGFPTNSSGTSSGDGDPNPVGDGDGDDDEGDGDGDGDLCELDCGLGVCVQIDHESYCECPEGTQWDAYDCGVCPVIGAVDSADLEIEVVDIEGRFLVGGVPSPMSEYDDANVWLENLGTGDRVLLGNTHDQDFVVRVTPGIYDVIYEVETPGAVLPHNTRARLEKLALFESQPVDIDIAVTSVSGEILLNGVPPPVSEYDDARIMFRQLDTDDEVFAANTHDGGYAINLVQGQYDIVYRLETPGPIIPRNDGAALESLVVSSSALDHLIELTSVPLQGNFLLDGAPPPASEYDDANIWLESTVAGDVALGNTHDGIYDVQVFPYEYDLVYMHETGPNVPQNQRGQLGLFVVDENAPTQIDIPTVQISGALTINGLPAPVSQFDDGVLHLEGVDSDDSVVLGNTHDGSYQVRLIPGAYDVFYSQETSGGTVPDNKHARVAEVLVDQSGSLDFNVDAVAISGLITFAGGQPPASAYEDGRIYLRDTLTDDAVLLGSTHDGDYAAIVTPGEYEVFYVQEAGGNVPGNQNALLASLSIGGPMSLDLDLPVVSLSGQFLAAGAPAPNMPSDGGQVYLRTLAGDSLLLGDTFAQAFTANLVAGTYGVYYRSEASISMPQNENGRFACITIE